MAKEFKTIGELVDLLESRGVKTDEETSSVLQREGYYAIVNGYKDTFLDRAAMQSSPGDVYKKGTTFRQIYDLFRLSSSLVSVLYTQGLSHSLIKCFQIPAAKYAIDDALRQRKKPTGQIQ